MIDLKHGSIDGEHIECLQKQCGLSPKLIEHANASRADGFDISTVITEADLPREVHELLAESRKFADGLWKAAPVPLALALEYCDAQSRLASKAAESMATLLAKRTESAAVTIEAMRKQLTPTGKGIESDLAAAGVEPLLADARKKIEGAAKIEALRGAVSILRSAADRDKARPRWLRQALAQHEADKHRASAD